MADLQPLTPHIARLRVPNFAHSNIYVVHSDDGDLLVDPGPIGTASTLLALDRSGALRLSRLLLTHAHPAHAGSASRVSRGTGVPTWIHPLDAPFVDGREPPLLPRGPRGRLLAALGRVVELCPPLYRYRLLEPGVPIGPLVPVATPGHTPGHVSYYHPAARALLSGDALLHDGTALRLPDEHRSVAPAAAHAALRALAPLGIDALLPGHGPPLLRNVRPRLDELLRAMPENG